MRLANCLLFVLLPVLLSSAVAHAFSGPFDYKGKQYYVVSASDPNEDTGDKVCAKANRTCVGYTAFTTDVCTHFHPKASTSSSFDGDRTGVYCNGPPQGGVCAAKKDTCHVCPQCNVGMECSSSIGSLYGEMYVECSGGDAPQEQIKAKPSFFSSFWGFFSNALERFKGLFKKTVVKTITVGPYPGRWGCEFVQSPWPNTNKKLVECGVPRAGDNYCTTVLTSPSAKAEVCSEDGLILCTNPCNNAQIIPDRCPFDINRPRGNQAPPINWCGNGVANAAPAGNPPAGSKLCPYACWLRDVSAGPAGIGNVNCEVAAASIHKAADSCPGKETQIGLAQPKDCSCQPVETVSQPCPESCTYSQAKCDVDVRLVGNGGVPCDGTFEGTKSNCKCVLKGGAWHVGTEYGIR